MSFVRYPSYIKSHVAWSPTIPASWKVLPTKRGFIRRKEVNSGMKCENRLSLTLNGVLPRSLDDMDGLQASEFETYQIFQRDDLVFKLIDLQNIKTSRVGLVHEEGIMSPAYIRLEPIQNKIFPTFAYWFFTDLYKREVFNKLGEGVRQTLGAEDLLVIPFFYPSIEEQKSISIFLNYETSKIDKLIQEQESLIDVLKEKRQAVISIAVTKGLYSSVKMSNSGVEWLGEIPEHWEITKIKYIATASNGLTYSPDDLVEQEEGVLVLRSSNIQQGDISLEDNVYVKMTVPEKAVVRSGDILICSRNGSRDLIGKNALIPDSLDGVAYGAFMMRLRSDISEYIYWILNSYIFKFQSSLFLTSTINQLTVSDLYGFQVPIPPKSEQFEIIKYLQESTKQINSLIENAKKSVFLLQERRSALISAAVTGQIDLRNYQIKEAA